MKNVVKMLKGLGKKERKPYVTANEMMIVKEALRIADTTVTYQDYLNLKLSMAGSESRRINQVGNHTQEVINYTVTKLALETLQSRGTF